MLDFVPLARCLRAFALLAPLACMSAYAQNIRWPSDSISLGTGYDTLTGEVRGRCVTAPSPSTVAGEKVNYSLTVVESESSFDSALNISVSAKYSGIEASARFSENKSFNRYSAYLLVSIVVESGTQSIVAGRVQPSLLPDDMKLLTQDLARFRERCGDKFMATQSVGGSYHALIEVQTSSEADRRSVYASISGGGGAFKGAAEMNQAIQTAVKNRSTRVTSVRTGSRGPVASDMVKILRDAENLPTQLAADKEPFRGVLVDYNTLAMPAWIKRERFNNDVKLRYLFEADAQANQIRSIISDMQFISTNLDQFPAANRDEMLRGISAAESVLADLTLEVRRCMRSGDPCGKYAPVKLTLPALPARLPGPSRAELEAAVESLTMRIKKSQETQNQLLYNDRWFNERGINSGVRALRNTCEGIIQELREGNKANGGYP